MATDIAFERIAANSTSVAEEARDYTVKVDATMLTAGASYYTGSRPLVRPPRSAERAPHRRVRQPNEAGFGQLCRLRERLFRTLP